MILVVNVFFEYIKDKFLQVYGIEGRMIMSTLEKTINLLNVLPEKQIEMIYSF